MYSSTEIRKACNRAINNIIFEGITDVEVFNSFFEIDFLKDKDTKKKFVDSITNDILNKKLENTNIKQHGKVLVPKNNIATFRICSLTDIYDEIFYLTLAILVAKEVEKKRINKLKNKVFSYRFNSKNNLKYLFDSKYNFTSFRDHVKIESLKDENLVMVECDIANFYDRLNLHRLESTLLSLKTVDKEAIKLINDLLLYWSNRDSYGIPVGSNASRILAEASLIEVDNYLLSKNINFCRFVDDYRIFAKDSTEAIRALTILTERLQLEGLFINSAKTKIKQIIKAENSTIETTNQESSQNDNEENILIENEPTEEKLKLSKVIRGYSGIIPTKFRALSNREKEKLQGLNFDEQYDEIKNEIIIEPEKIRNLIKIIVAKDEWEKITDVLTLIFKYPQFTPYFIDVITKNEDKISDENKDIITSEFKKMIFDEETPEYILIYLIRLFGEGIYENKIILLDFFFNLKRNSGDYVGRAVLDALASCSNLNRGDALHIKTYFQRADIYEKRRILFILNRCLEIEEKNAYFKNIGMIEKDLLILHMTDKKKDFMK